LEAAEVLRLDSKYSVEKDMKRLTDKDKGKLKMRSDAIRKAGLPE
jgi:hypothetical protein